VGDVTELEAIASLFEEFSLLKPDTKKTRILEAKRRLTSLAEADPESLVRKSASGLIDQISINHGMSGAVKAAVKTATDIARAQAWEDMVREGGGSVDVLSQLVMGPGGMPRPSRDNTAKILFADPKWKITRHEITKEIFINEDRITDQLVLQVLLDLNDRYGLHGVKKNDGFDAMELCAEDTNPLKEHVRDLPQWDGTERVKGWLHRGLGVEDSALTREIGQCFLISMIARAYKPGCKVDTVLLLIGPQGSFKSTVVQVLGGPFTTDQKISPNKDGKQALGGKWVVEIAEIDKWRKIEAGEQKAFISNQTDEFRPPYGRASIKVPRTAVFIATTNKYHMLDDETGSRRFWPVEVGQVDVEWMKANRDQLLSEASVLYSTQHPWWLEGELVDELEENTRAKYDIVDAWQPSIESWLQQDTHPGEITTKEVAYLCLGMREKELVGTTPKRISKIMTYLGYRMVTRSYSARVPERDDRGNQYVWNRREYSRTRTRLWVKGIPNQQSQEKNRECEAAP